MSTHCAIGIRNNDGSITAIYCHWDGYPAYNGKILKEYYTNRQKIEKLLSLGNLSILAAMIGESNNFNNPIEGICLFYGRDRGDENTEAKVAQSLEGMMDLYDWCNYYYLFENSEWFCAEDGGEFQLLSNVLKNGFVRKF